MRVSAIVPAYRRARQTLATVAKLHECSPAPDEILVHVDAEGEQCRVAIEREFPRVRLLLGSAPAGPGGARNQLIAAARNEFVASFDDDSYPLDHDYFGRVQEVFKRFPAAAVLSAAIMHRGERAPDENGCFRWTADFIGCGCAYRRSAFLQTSGYVPLPLAYGMEEVDLSIRLHAKGMRILHAPWLRVYHDTDLSRHADRRVTAASIANLALLAYLRYPAVLWPAGVAQCLSRVGWLVRNGRISGILDGIAMIPAHLKAYARFRQLVDVHSIRSYLALRRMPMPVREY